MGDSTLALACPEETCYRHPAIAPHLPEIACILPAIALNIPRDRPHPLRDRPHHCPRSLLSLA
ncbi:hypothetical protein [Halomicronema sp. CCY15110]|uniref:hypothetical protein n=1 Tax=Halomicronema sp. CCY15110 TaxID=2767773 RepID=UPI00194E55F3|nr:hypothetical protein [Halomicronema sp. CCY15110]